MGGLVSASTGRRVRVVLFDTFGTLVDWRSGIIAALQRFAAEEGLVIDAAELADAWRAQYQPRMQEVRAGSRPYVTLDVIHTEGLLAVLDDHGIDHRGLNADRIAALVHSWHKLEAWPDVVDGLNRLRRHAVVAPLSNAHTALLVGLSRHAGMHWDLVFGSDGSRAYKPDRRAYQAPAELLGLHPAETMLVAAHNDDLDGARRAGLATAFLSRPAEFGAEQQHDLEPTDHWDLVVDDVGSVAEAFSGPARRH